MKKLSLLISFLFCAIVSFAQLTPVPRGNPNQIDAFKGINTGLVGTMLTPNDTTNSPATPYYGALTVLPSDAGKDTIPIWMSNGVKWIRFSGGSAFTINDTIYTRVPIAVDRITLPGKQILYLLHLDGIVSPGYVIWTGFGLDFNVTPAEYYINYRQFFSPFALVTLATAPVSDSRIDLFIVDSAARASALTGTASATPITPQTNPSFQLSLTSVTINAGDTVPSGIGLETIYNNHGAPPAEWIPTVNGNIAADFDNLANPYTLAPPKAAFVSVYGDSSNMTFTKGSGTDTVQTGEILRGFIYFNVPFVNQLQFQWFNGSTAVSNSIAINAGYGINPNNTTAYQIFAIPLNAWNFTPASDGIFNRLVIRMAGADSSGAGGFYLDYLQLQTGLLNIDQAPPAWLVNGNGGTNPTINFLGTTDANSLRFKVNNFHGGWLSTSNALSVGFGYGSLPLSSIAFWDNSAFGAFALQHTSTGTGNAAIGTYGLTNNTTGSANVAAGVAALFSNVSGYGNTAAGTNALYSNIGHDNTALGDSALRGNTTGNFNIGLGYKVAIANTTTSNTFSISDSTPHMVYAIDTATGTAPSIIGYDPVTHRWGHYANTGGGGGGSSLANFYLKDSSLSSDRTVNVNGKQLIFSDGGGGAILYIDPTSWASQIGSFNNVSNAQVELSTVANTGANLIQFELNAFDGVSAEVAINGNVIANNLTYTAATHTINGTIIYNTPPSGAATDSIRTWDAATGQERMRDAASFGGNETLQQVFDLEDGNAILNKDDTISINRHNFFLGENFGGSINGILIVDSSASGTGAETIIGSAYGVSNANLGNIATSSNADGSNFTISSTNNAGSFNNAGIFGSADATSSSIAYSAVVHSFTGIVTISKSFSLPYNEQTSTYTITASDYAINCPSGTFTVTLPTAVGITGRIYVVKNSGLGVITLDGDGSETIDGSATQPIAAGSSITVQSTGAGWIIE